MRSTEGCRGPWRSPRRLGLTVLVVGLLVAATSTDANAGNFGPTAGGQTSVNFQDDSLMSYQFDRNLSSRMRTATTRTLTNSYATTDLNILKVGDGHDNTWNNHYAQGSMPSPGLIGYHVCVYAADASEGTCAHGHIRYRYGSLSTTTYEWALACHETGHSVGLRHEGAAAYSKTVVRCMYNPVPTDDPNVGPHNVAHINSRY